MADRRIARAALSGKFMLLNQGSVSAAALVDGQMYCLPWDLGAPASIDQTLVEVMTTPGGAGSVVRAAWFNDDGTFNRPGSLIVDLGTVDTTTLGVKTFAQIVSLPAGRVWCCVVAQGAAAPGPTLRLITTASVPIAVPTMTALFQQFVLQTGVTGALPAPPNPVSSSNVAPCVAVRFV